ncbi:hypothetical protein X746_19710 [Mesorhizobium sp. LNJC380A00]|nr:hypothetical protein X746_19710 [Mesorhizobium sp. LNJC380A00]
MAAKRLRIGVLFGGRSAEHEVSLLSATNVMAALDPAKYDAVPIFVTREAQWQLSHFKDGALATPSDGTQLCLASAGWSWPDAGDPRQELRACWVVPVFRRVRVS